MNEARRAWLELQRDLGGDEAILDVAYHPVPEPMLPTGMPPTAINTPPEEPVRQWRVPEHPAGAEPAWLVGAPGIPGAGIDLPLASPTARAAGWLSLTAIAVEIAACRRCPLAEQRTNTVPGEGNAAARLMVVGEGPGEQEDLSGRPFVGRAGNLLDKMLESIGLPRQEVFIANVVKCRPPRNRAPLPDERASCSPYLERQIALIQPKVILALGGTAAEALLGVKQTLGSLRLKVHTLGGIPLVVTYHPAALLRNPNWKRPAWDDIRIARQLVDAET